MTSVSPAPASIAVSSSSANPSQRSPSLVAHPLLVVRAQVEQQHAAAGRRRCAPLRRPRAPDPAAWCSACDSIATSTARPSIGSFSSSPFFQITLETRRRAGQRPARASAPSADRSTAMTREAQRPPRSSGSLRRSRGRRPSAAAAAGRARATRPPSCGPARAGARRRPGPACASKFSLRSRSTSCSRASSARPTSVDGGRARTAPAAAARAARAVAAVADAGAQAVVAEAAVALLGDQAGVLEQPEMARHARLREPEHRRSAR